VGKGPLDLTSLHSVCALRMVVVVTGALRSPYLTGKGRPVWAAGDGEVSPLAWPSPLTKCARRPRQLAGDYGGLDGQVGSLGRW
jgi:hypothetical protein